MQPVSVVSQQTPLPAVSEANTSSKRHFLIPSDIIAGLSLANVLFLPIWWELLTYRRHSTFFMETPPSRVDYVAVILNVSIFAALIVIGMTAARKYIRNPVVRPALQTAVFMLPALSVLFDISGRYPLLRQIPVRYLGQRTALVLVAACALVLLYALLHRRLRVIAMILFPFVPLTLGQALWKIVSYNDVAFANKPLAPFKPVAPDTPRIVWIIFDRLDQRLTFVNRPESIHLPEFDRLRAEAIYCSNAYPPSSATLFSMPSLVNGRLVAAASEENTDTLHITYDGGSTAVWGREDTVFSDARTLGLNSGVVGWYLPYCRVFDQTLSSCAWFEMPAEFNSFSLTKDASGSLPHVMQQEVRSLLEFGGMSPFGQSLQVLHQRSNYEAMLRIARENVVDPRLNVLLLHLPIPHGPFFYNRHSGKPDLRYPTAKGYIDNLVLADRTLGLLRDDLQSAGLWDSTTVVVSSDHSNGSAPLLDGMSDERVPFMLKLARQTRGIQFDGDFNTVITRDLLVSILRRNIIESEQAVNWIASHGTISRSLHDFPVDRRAATHHLPKRKNPRSQRTEPVRSRVIF